MKRKRSTRKRLTREMAQPLPARKVRPTREMAQRIGIEAVADGTEVDAWLLTRRRLSSSDLGPKPAAAAPIA